MAVQTLTQFNAGELSPLLIGRTDLPVYANGLRRGLNVFVLAHGPVVRRPGNRRAGAARSSARWTASFIFGVGDAYTIEFSDLKMRFWRANRTQVESSPGVPLEVTTPWTAIQARALRWHQSADVMWFTHPDFPMQELRRTALGPPETFTLAAAVFIDGPYYSENITTTTLTTAGIGTGAIGVGASAAVPEFVAAAIGRHIRLKIGHTDNQGWAWGIITAVADPQNITVNFKTEVVSNGPTGAWRLGLYSAQSGYPSCICIHQERLALGSNAPSSFPRVDCSRSGAFLNFGPGTDDDHAIQMVIAADSVPVVRDVKSERVLVIVTGSGVLRASTSGSSTALTPLNIDVSKLPTTTGGANVPALTATGSVLYLDPQGRSIGEIRARSEIYADALGYRELTIRSEHLLRESPGVAMAWADKPWGQIIVAREDGAWLAGTYAPDQDVVAFTPQLLAGGGKVESVNVLPTLQGSEIWMLVNRNGSRTIEVLANLLRDVEPDREAVNLDLAVTLRDARATTLTLLSTDGAGVQTWQAGASVFVAGDVDRGIRVLERADNDRLNMPAWNARTLRILSRVNGTTITARPEGTSPTSPIASGEWLVSITTVTGLGHMNGQMARGLFDAADVGPFLVSGGAYTPEHECYVATVGLAPRAEVQPMPPNPPTRKGSVVARDAEVVKPRVRVIRSAGLKQMRWNGTLTGELPLRQRATPLDATPPYYTGDIELDGDPTNNTPVGPHIVAEGGQPFCIAHMAVNYSVGEVG